MIQGNVVGRQARISLIPFLQNYATVSRADRI
jgi:hypothetical protein